jgi:hypothetical protein
VRVNVTESETPVLIEYEAAQIVTVEFVALTVTVASPPCAKSNG